MQKHWLFGTAAAVLTVLVCASIAYAALTFEATTITSDAAMTITTAVGSNVAVTRGISANAATTTDSFYTGGLNWHSGATASATAIVIGTDVRLYRSAANTLTITGGLASATTTDSLYVGGVLQHTGGTASATALVIGGDTVLFRNAANQLRLQGTLSASAGVSANAATTTDSLYVGGVLQHTGATASATALVIGNDVRLYRSAENILTIADRLATLNLANAETIGNSTNNVLFLYSTTVAVATDTASTTAGHLWVSAPAGANASTSPILQIGGHDEAGQAWAARSCIQMWSNSKAYRLYISTNNTLAIEIGACRDDIST